MEADPIIKMTPTVVTPTLVSTLRNTLPTILPTTLAPVELRSFGIGDRLSFGSRFFRNAPVERGCDTPRVIGVWIIVLGREESARHVECLATLLEETVLAHL